MSRTRQTLQKTAQDSCRPLKPSMTWSRLEPERNGPMLEDNLWNGAIAFSRKNIVDLSNGTVLKTRAEHCRADHAWLKTIGHRRASPTCPILDWLHILRLCSDLVQHDWDGISRTPSPWRTFPTRSSSKHLIAGQPILGWQTESSKASYPFAMPCLMFKSPFWRLDWTTLCSRHTCFRPTKRNAGQYQVRRHSSSPCGNAVPGTILSLIRLNGNGPG
ncbi:hypothetical protein ANO11243_056170 [Dothideomycetidae sp. 11243]|nr:hypothetical protein ANO11243_056170 [fungal sp. No.11243]